MNLACRAVFCRSSPLSCQSQGGWHPGALPRAQAIAELPEAVLHQALTHLQAAEFLYETQPFPEHAYTFKHALTHEVAHGCLLQVRRRALHARIVEALEALGSDRAAEQVERLATMPCAADYGTRP